MRECKACCPKGSCWPGHLDFSKLMPYQKACAWCNGTKQVSDEVAEVYTRLASESGLLSVRANSLAAQAIDAENIWEQMRNKKRPKNISEAEWQKELLNRNAAAIRAREEAAIALKEKYEQDRGK